MLLYLWKNWKNPHISHGTEYILNVIPHSKEVHHTSLYNYKMKKTKQETKKLWELLKFRVNSEIKLSLKSTAVPISHKSD